MTPLKLFSRRTVVLLLAAMTTLGATLGAFAQGYPSRPIKVILGFSPGGVGDIIARLYAQKMFELLKTPVIVDNKPGANQLTAIQAVRNSHPDGYTLYLATGS